MSDYYVPFGGFIFALLIRELLTYEKSENSSQKTLILFSHLISFLFFLPILVVYTIPKMNEAKLDAYQNTADLLMMLCGLLTLIALLYHPCNKLGSRFISTIGIIIFLGLCWLHHFARFFAV